MGLSGTGIAGLVSPPGQGGTAAADVTQDPDLVVFNAKVYTVDPLEPRAEAFAVKAGRFAVVGSSEDVKSLVGKWARAFDAKQ
jgi:predicted amidohydrolase YtcJ